MCLMITFMWSRKAYLYSVCSSTSFFLPAKTDGFKHVENIHKYQPRYRLCIGLFLKPNASNILQASRLDAKKVLRAGVKGGTHFGIKKLSVNFIMVNDLNEDCISKVRPQILYQRELGHMLAKLNRSNLARMGHFGGNCSKILYVKKTLGSQFEWSFYYGYIYFLNKINKLIQL